MPFKNTYEVKDRVITPLGKGVIMTKPHGRNGDCMVKLDEPLRGGSSDGQIYIDTNTFQLKHEERSSYVSKS